MSCEIKESDWKLFRQLHPIALERFSKRILSEIGDIGAQSAKSFHRRYLDIFDLIGRRDKDLARLFDNPRRSSALTQLAEIRAECLLTDDEFQQFSEEIRTHVGILLESRRA